MSTQRPAAQQQGKGGRPVTEAVEPVPVDNGSHGAPRVAGAALAVVFDAMTRLRHGKPIHPREIVARAVLKRTGSTSRRWGVPWLDEPGTDFGIVRFSRAVGLSTPVPDVLGLTLRLGTLAHTTTYCSPRPACVRAGDTC